MKKRTALVLALVLALSCVALAGCQNGDNRAGSGTASVTSVQTGEESLTMEQVKELAKKGGQLTWADITKYKGTNAGKEMVVVAFPVEDGYKLTAAGTDLDKAPMYVTLTKNGKSKGIDIRYEDIDAYLKEK